MTREEFLAAKTRSKPVGDLIVRELTLAQRLEMERNVKEGDGAPSRTATLIEAATFDQAGVRFFKPGDAAAIDQLPAPQLAQLSKAASELNNLNVDDATKN